MKTNCDVNARGTYIYLHVATLSFLFIGEKIVKDNVYLSQMIILILLHYHFQSLSLLQAKLQQII